MDPENKNIRPSHRPQTSTDTATRPVLAKLYERNPNIDNPFPYVVRSRTSSNAGSPHEEPKAAVRQAHSPQPSPKPSSLRSRSLSPVQRRLPSSKPSSHNLKHPAFTPLQPSISLPDFQSPPYKGPIGAPFPEAEYDLLADSMDLRVLDLYSVCIIITSVLRADEEFLEFSGYSENLLNLGEAGIEEVRLSSYLIAWKLLTGKWSWEELLAEQLLVETIKRNLRHVQLGGKRLGNCCDTMLELGFDEDYLH